MCAAVMCKDGERTVNGAKDNNGCQQCPTCEGNYYYYYYYYYYFYYYYYYYYYYCVSDIDECTEPNYKKCDTNAICTNKQPSYSCECKQGYFGDGFSCQRKAHTLCSHMLFSSILNHLWLLSKD